MVVIKSILVPTDFSPGAAVAIDQALALAKPFGATVTLLHVYSLPTYVFPDGSTFVAGAEVTARITSDVEEALSREAQEAGRSGVTVKTRSQMGVPWDEIARTAREYDLVVMGTHGRTGLRHLFLGSVAEKVVRHAPCPVLTVRLPEEEARHPGG
jgi:nucleotide-binding universal stress UspA family protein